MFQRFTTTVVAFTVMAVIAVSGINSASPAFAKGGHSGGHSGGHHMSSHQHMNHSQSFVKTSHKNHGSNHNQHKGHHRRSGHGYWGWDGGSGYDDYGADGAVAVDPVDSGDPAVVPTASPITLLNPAETGMTVSYTLGDADYSIDPARRMVHNDGTQVIAFDRGGEFGQASYTLQPGTYGFVKTAQGIDLQTVTPQVTSNLSAIDKLVTGE
jgi:hypothetical protein